MGYKSPPAKGGGMPKRSDHDGGLSPQQTHPPCAKGGWVCVAKLGGIVIAFIENDL